MVGYYNMIIAIKVYIRIRGLITQQVLVKGVHLLGMILVGVEVISISIKYKRETPYKI